MDESLNGATTIRAFGTQETFIQKMDRLIDDSQAALFPSLVVARQVHTHDVDILSHKTDFFKMNVCSKRPKINIMKVSP